MYNINKVFIFLDMFSSASFLFIVILEISMISDYMRCQGVIAAVLSDEMFIHIRESQLIRDYEFDESRIIRYHK